MKFTHTFLIIVFLVFNHSLYADDMLASQRALFSKVEGEMKLGRSGLFKRTVSKLSDYPLFPYLKFYELRGRLHSAKENELKNFLYKYAGVPVTERLRHDWIKHLARRGKWELIVEIYQPPLMLEGKKVTCYYARALIHTERLTELRSMLTNLWTVNFSQPKQCDFVFDWGFVNGYINDELVWQRLLLVIRKKAGLARYLGGRLSVENRKWYRLLETASVNPEAVLLQIQTTFSSSVFEKDIADFALKRLARKNLKKADRHLKNMFSRCANCAGLYETQRELGILAARQLDVVQAYDWLSSVPAVYHNEQSKYWQIRSALRQEDWPQVLRSIALLDESQRKQPQWRYWHANAMYMTGRVQPALAAWKTLSKLPNYYGYLSADKVNADYQLETVPPINFSEAELRIFSSRAPIARMRELMLLNRPVDTRREFLFIGGKITSEEYLKLANLAEQWEWPDGAIRAIAASDVRTDMRFRFPVPYRDEVQKITKRLKVPEEWIYAIMRRESAFMEKVKSPAGALGLMQLMPNTARIMLSSLKIKGRSQRHILRPDINIRLGSAYFARLYRRYDNEIVPALAAYNAGGTHLSRWLRRSPVDNIEVWVDTIPITETRLYVRAVLFYMIVYTHRLDKTVYRLEEIM